MAQKYGAGGAYAKYSKEKRNAMQINELSMTCFGQIGSHTGMGGGDIMCDPHLKGEVSESKGNKKSAGTILNDQVRNVLQNAGIDVSALGSKMFNSSVDIRKTVMDRDFLLQTWQNLFLHSCICHLLQSM